MPALNFQARFAPLVESGTKDQTIRARRKDGRDPKVGDRLYLYTGMRTKACRKLGEGICRAIFDVTITPNGFLVDGVPQNDYHAGCRAREDGFAGIDDMREWFNKTHGLPFNGLLIRWSPCRE